MQFPSQTELASLEERVARALRTLDTGDLQILGYGEVTTVFRLDAASGSFACKRFPIIRTLDDANEHVALVHRYIEALGERGVTTVGSELLSLPGGDGRAILYLVQPIVDSTRIGPNHFARIPEAEALDAFGRILDLMAASVSPELAPDGQLSNWVFSDEGILYIDVSTPFMRDERGVERVNWDALNEASLNGIMRPLRSYYRKKIPEILEFYYSIRGQVLDFLANLRKEKLDHLLPACIDRANAQLSLDPPITLDEVKKYYNENADLYAFIMGIRRVDRQFHRWILRRPYPNFIPPKIDRNKF